MVRSNYAKVQAVHTAIEKKLKRLHGPLFKSDEYVQYDKGIPRYIGTFEMPFGEAVVTLTLTEEAARELTERASEARCDERLLLRKILISRLANKGVS